MKQTEKAEFVYEPMQMHDKKVVQAYNDFMDRHDYDISYIEDENELIKVEEQLATFIVEEPDFLEPYFTLLEVYEMQGEDKKQYNKVLENAYKAALKLATDKNGAWHEKIEWGWLENRSIIRALQGGAMKRWEEGKRKEAKEVFQNLLKVNPSDNSGVRYALLALLEGMSHDKFIIKLGDTGYMPPSVDIWFNLNVKSHKEFADWLRIFGDME